MIRDLVHGVREDVDGKGRRRGDGSARRCPRACRV
jgi:hypothetical protein